MDIRIPSLSAPFRSVLNPYVREADERVARWVGDRGFLSPETYRQSRFTWFAARCFPDADLPQLSLAAAFNVWLFWLDDSCDAVPVGQKYEYLRALSTEIVLALAGRGASGEPLVDALAGLWQELKALGSRDWESHFLQAMLRYLDACKLEAQWLDQDTWPTVAAYTSYRPYLGAVHLEPALSEILCGHILQPRQRNDPRISALRLLCCNIVCWSNDLFSLDKEMSRGDKGNLALVLAHERGFSLEEAVRAAAALHEEDVRCFAALARALEGDVPPALMHYVRSLEHIVAANMEWSLYDTQRYRFVMEGAA
jgi:hypothetical protein